MNPEDLDALLTEVAPTDARPQAQPAATSGQPEATPATTQPAPTEAVPATSAPPPTGRVIDRLDPAGQIGGAIVTGAAKSIYETKDFLFGKTREEDKTELRRNVEQLDKDLAESSIANSFVSGLSQFATGMLGAGKLVGLAKAVPAVGGAVGALEATSKGAAALSSAKAAAVGAVAFDPSGPRLSDLVQKFPALQNPVSEFLASKPGDSAALGRAKNALESIGVDAALAGVFAASVAGFKALKAGDQAAIAATQQELGAAIAHKDAKLAVSKGDLGTVDTLRQSHPEAVAQAEAALAPPTVGPADAIQSDAMSARSPRRSLAEREAAGEAVDYGPDAPAALQEGGGGTSVPSVPQAKDALASEAMSAKPPARPNRAAELEGDIALPAIDVPPETPTLTRVDSPTQGAGPEGLPPKARLIDVSDEQVSKLISDGIADTNELLGPGGWDGAIGRGYRFGDGGSIPWQKLHGDLGQEGEGPLGAMVRRVADTLEPELNKARGGNAEGVLTDAQVDRLVAQRVNLYNEDPQALLGALQLAGKNAKTMAVNMEAAGLVGNRVMLDALNLRSRIQLGMLEEFGGDLKAARAALEQHLEIASSFFAEGQAMRASAGRAMRRNRADFAFTAEDLAAMKGLDDNRFFNLLDAVGHDFQVANKLVKPGFWARLKDDAQYLYVNNLLWGLRTHFVNTLTNTYMLTARPLERIIGHGIQGDMEAVRENARQYGYMGASLADSFRDAVRTWKTGDSIMSPHTAEITPQGVADAGRGTNWVTEGFKQWDSVPNVLSNAYVGFMKAAGTPTRLLGTMDELAKQVTYRSKVMAQAHSDGIAAGLEGQALNDHVKKSLLNAFDDAGRAVDLRALEEANIATFQQDLIPGTFGATVQNTVANHALLRFVVPFVKTPTNVLRVGWKMTPGLNALQAEYRQMIRGEMGQEQQAQAIGQMAMGSLFMGTAAWLASTGYVTGGGPTDPKLRQTLMATGWQPYSFVIPREDGSKTYVNFGRYDPVAMPMGIIADIIDILDRDQDGDGAGEQALNAAGGLMLALAKQITQKTYLTSLHDTLDALMDPDRNMSKVAGSTAANFVPFSSGLRFGNPDPYLRDTRGVVDKLMATVPGLSEKLPARRDVFGDPLTVHKGLWVDGEATAVDAEVRRMVDEAGVMFGPPTPTHNGVDLREVTMADGRNAYDRYQELAGHPTRGPSMKETVARIMKSPAYQKAPDGDVDQRGTRLAMLTGTISKYRDGAFKQLKADPNVRAALAKRDAESRAALVAAQAPKSDKQTGAEQIVNLGKAVGVDLSGAVPQ